MGDVSLAHVLFRLICALVVVSGLLALAMRVGRRRAGLGGSGRRAPIDIVARHQLGRNAALAVVRTGDRMLVLGVTEASVTLLRDDPVTDTSVTPVAPGAAGPGGRGETSAPFATSKTAASPRTAMNGAMRQVSARMSVVAAMRERTVRRG